MARRRSATPDDAPSAPREDDAPFAFVPDERGGVTVMRDGHPQSHVDLDEPTAIEFEYVQHFALLLDALNPTPPAPLGVTHIGGAGLTLARCVDATRPGSPQIVLEPDQDLTEAVRRELPLPRGHRIRVRGVDGVAGMPTLKTDSANAVVLDAFAGGQVPGELVAPSFASEVARVLRPSGVFLANLSDEPGMAWAGRAIETFRAVLPHALVVAGQEVLKGRRFGNIVLFASARSEAIDGDAVRRAAARALFPTGVRAGEALARFTRGADPFTDADAERSPEPPHLGAWRVR